MDGLVGGDVHVGRAGRELPGVARRDAAEATGLAIGGDVDLGVRRDLPDRGLAPMAGHHVIDGLARRGEIERQQGLLGGGAAGQEQHRIVVGNPDQRAQVGFGFGGHGDEFGAAVADLDDGCAHAVPVEHFRLGLEQDRFRQSRGAGTEIEDARHGLPAEMKP